MAKATEANSTDDAFAGAASSNAQNELKYTKERREKMIQKLIELYKENDCLWNVRAPEFFDSSLKKEAWESIAKRMNTTWNNVKCCVYCLRCRLNFEMTHRRQHCHEASNFFLAEQFKFLRLTSDKKKFVAAQQSPRRPPTAKPQADKPTNETEHDAPNDKQFYEHLYKVNEQRAESNTKKLRKWSELMKKLPEEPQTPVQPKRSKPPSYHKLENYFRERRSPLTKTVAELRNKAYDEFDKQLQMNE